MTTTAEQNERLVLEAFDSVVDLGNLLDARLIQQAGGPLAGRDFGERGES
jgi:hypothetical protein